MSTTRFSGEQNDGVKVRHADGEPLYEMGVKIRGWIRGKSMAGGFHWKLVYWTYTNIIWISNIEYPTSLKLVYFVVFTLEEVSSFSNRLTLALDNTYRIKSIKTENKIIKNMSKKF